MPTVSRFYGILIRLYWNEVGPHKAPPFHAAYGGEEAVFSIPDADLLAGEIPRRQTRLVQAWGGAPRGGAGTGVGPRRERRAAGADRPPPLSPCRRPPLASAPPLPSRPPPPRGGRGEDGPSILVIFDDGSARRLRLAPLLVRRPFAPLADPVELARITVQPYGHGLEWACGADTSARGIYEDGEPVAVTFAEPAAVEPVMDSGSLAMLGIGSGRPL